MSNPNPLQKYFRQPAIYITLPSKGKFYPESGLDMPPNNELPVYPMTAMDEITYRTADALFNGSAITTVINSCIPNIRDPWNMPSLDITTVLIGIRIASYGHNMDFESKCPHCEEQNNYGLDLRTVLEAVQTPDYEKPLEAGDITVYFQPLTYRQQNQNAMVQFEDQKLLESISNVDLPEEEKLKMINEAFVKLGRMSMTALGQSISMVKAGDDVVTDAEHIREFVNNCDRSIYEAIRKKVLEIRQATELKPIKVQCQSCEKGYETPFTLDVSNFFVSDS